MTSLIFSKRQFDDFVLGADVGGTNTNIGLFGIKNNNTRLLFSLHYFSKKLKKPDDAIVHFLDFVKINYNIVIKRGCLAVAGVVNEKKDFAKITNVHWDVDAKSIRKKTGLNLTLINDFEAIGYGINMLKKQDYKTIKRGKTVPKAPIAIVGAGTGLGRTTLIHNGRYYVPMPTEGGHTDLPCQSKEELDLLDFIKKECKIKNYVPSEMILSGKGISAICLFYSKKIKSKNTSLLKKSNFAPELISRHRNKDRLCKKTFEVFAKFYARFAKNCALDCLSYGGVYIAGGIAPKNQDIFGRSFIREFQNNWRHPEVLKKIPIFLIKNYDMGLLGAGFFAGKTK